MSAVRPIKDTLGVEPAAIAGAVEAGLAVALAFGVSGLTSHTVGLIMACVTAGLGLATAIITDRRVLSAVVGLAKAALALAVGYGLPVTDVQTGALIAFITVIGGLWLRGQVTPTLGPSKPSKRHRSEA